VANGTWTGWQPSLGGMVNHEQGSTSGLAVASSAPGRMNVFRELILRRPLLLLMLEQNTFHNNTWSGWKSITKLSLPCQLAAASSGQGRIDVFRCETGFDMLHGTLLNDSWSGWQSLGGVCASGPAATSGMPGRLAVF